MTLFVPKIVPEDTWRPLYAERTYAIRSNQDDVIHFRLGMGKSFYLEIAPTQMGHRIINVIEYESGETSLLARLSDQETLTIGRGAPCEVRIVHPYVSRQHLELVLDGSVLMAKDRGSVNGTYCHTDNIHFDIEKYIDTHPLDKAAGETLDEIHDAFGPTLDDFLKKYLQKKEKPYDTDPDIK